MRNAATRAWGDALWNVWRLARKTDFSASHKKAAGDPASAEVISAIAHLQSALDEYFEDRGALTPKAAKKTPQESADVSRLLNDLALELKLNNAFRGL
jgi:hypothetical protein